MTRYEILEAAGRELTTMIQETRRNAISRRVLSEARSYLDTIRLDMDESGESKKGR